MSQNNRVFITGLGALTACGLTLDETWQHILNGQHGLADITQWDVSSWPCRLGGELKGFKPAKMLPDKKLVKMISQQDALGINAAKQAIEHSQVLHYRDNLSSQDVFNENTGVYVGSPGNKYYQQYDFLPLLARSAQDMSIFAEHLFSDVHPMWLLRILPNNVLAYTGISYEFKGPNHNITNHAVGGMQAVVEAYNAIKNGQAERAVVVAYDVAIEPQALFYYNKLGVISPRHLKPFDKDHDGTILAEGAAALFLESEASAKARDASCYAEVSGGVVSNEQRGLFSIEENGTTLAQSLKDLLGGQSVSPESVGLLVAHGNGNPKSDLSEAQAIEKAFAGYSVPITGFKWSTGHTICASGVLDTVLATKAMSERCIPGIANFQEPAAGCKTLSISHKTRSICCDTPYAIIINRGFASLNACVMIKACE